MKKIINRVLLFGGIIIICLSLSYRANADLKRVVDKADLFKCRVLLTMLLREDHFSNGSLLIRFNNGQINKILLKVITILEEGEFNG